MDELDSSAPSIVFILFLICGFFSPTTHSTMENHVLNKLSIASIVIASFTVLILCLQTPKTCSPPQPASDNSSLRFPKSTCDVSHRKYIPIAKKNHRIWNTRSFQTQVSFFTHFFQTLGLLHNHSRVLCVSAGAGHEVMALKKMGVDDVTGIELIDSPPLVNRADPHNLPFSNSVFDLGFSAHLAEALFPARFVSEMERTVRPDGACVVVVEQCGDEEVREIADLFRNSMFLSAENVTLIGSEMTKIVMKVKSGM